MGFIIKIPKAVVPTTTTLPPVFTIPPSAFKLLGFGSISGKVYNVGGSSFINSTAPNQFSQGNLQIDWTKTDGSITVNNDNTLDISLDIEYRIRNKDTANIKEFVGLTLLVDISSISGNLRSLESSFSPTNATKSFGIITSNILGVRYDDLEFGAGFSGFIRANGNIKAVVVNGEIPQIINLHSIDDRELPLLGGRVKRDNSVGTVNIGQRLILGNSASEFGINQISIDNGNDTDNWTYTNNTRNDSNELYSFGSLLDYDDSLVPSYIFSDGSTPSFTVASLTTLVTTTSTSTSTSSTTIAPFSLTDGQLVLNTLSFTVNGGESQYFIDVYAHDLYLEGTTEPRSGQFIKDYTINNTGAFTDSQPLLIPNSSNVLVIVGVDGGGREDVITVAIERRSTSTTFSNPEEQPDGCFSQQDVDNISLFSGSGGEDAVLVEFDGNLGFDFSRVTGAIFSSDCQCVNDFQRVDGDDINNTIVFVMDAPLEFPANYVFSVTTDVSNCNPNISFSLNSQGAVSFTR